MNKKEIESLHRRKRTGSYSDLPLARGVVRAKPVDALRAAGELLEQRQQLISERDELELKLRHLSTRPLNWALKQHKNRLGQRMIVIQWKLRELRIEMKRARNASQSDVFLSVCRMSLNEELFQELWDRSIRLRQSLEDAPDNINDLFPEEN